MITFEQYLEMQWLANAARAVGRKMGLVKPDAQPAPQPAPQPATPGLGMTPYGQMSDPPETGAFASTADYFDGNAQYHQGGTNYYVDKNSMTPEQKQAYWGMKHKEAQGDLKKQIQSISSYLANQAGGNQQYAKLVSIVGKKASDFVDRLTATYRKGGTAAQGTMSSLTAKGWSENVMGTTPQTLLQMFEKIKNDFIQTLTRQVLSGHMDKDVGSLYTKMHQELIKYIKNLKAK